MADAIQDRSHVDAMQHAKGADEPDCLRPWRQPVQLAALQDLNHGGCRSQAAGQLGLGGTEAQSHVAEESRELLVNPAQTLGHSLDADALRPASGTTRMIVSPETHVPTTD